MSDRVADAVAELYAADPADFTARRKALADEARAAGQRDAAKQIAALRKPTRAAWVVNTLARADPDAPGRLTALAAALRAAAEVGDGRKLRELSARRGTLLDSLASRALDAAGVTDPPAALRAEVTETLTAALADPDTAQGFAAGTLTRAPGWAGFGLFVPPKGTAPLFESRPVLGDTRAARPPGGLLAPQTPSGSTSGAPELKGATRPSDTPRDEFAARRRKNFDDAERIAATATRAAAAAVSREEELEVEVRDLEERLTQARAELAAARMHARRAESAERKAQQNRDRLEPPRLTAGYRP